MLSPVCPLVMFPFNRPLSFVLSTIPYYVLGARELLRRRQSHICPGKQGFTRRPRPSRAGRLQAGRSGGSGDVGTSFGVNRVCSGETSWWSVPKAASPDLLRAIQPDITPAQHLLCSQPLSPLGLSCSLLPGFPEPLAHVMGNRGPGSPRSLLQISHLGRHWVDQKYSGLLPGTSSGQLGHVGLEATGWTCICVDGERGARGRARG